MVGYTCRLWSTLKHREKVSLGFNWVPQWWHVIRRNIPIYLPISFRCSRLVGPGKDFVAIWIPVGLSSGLSPWCNPLTVVPLCGHARDWHLIGLWLTCCVIVVSSVARTIRWMCESTIFVHLQCKYPKPYPEPKAPVHAERRNLVLTAYVPT